jgi:RNase adaptor protein for sRNA GlmZ degradation
MTKNIILIIWPSCVWKSSVADTIFNLCDGIFHIKSDLLKKLISWYNPDRDKEFVSSITFDLCEQVMKSGLSIVIEPHQTSWYIELAQQYGYNLAFVYLEAPYEVLVERFNHRVELYHASGSKWYMNVNIDKFRSLYDQYVNLLKEESGMVFDTSKMSSNQVADKVIQQLYA